MLTIREYENTSVEDKEVGKLTGIIIDNVIDINNIVFSVIVNRDSLKEYLKIFNFEDTVALYTFKDDYFEVTSDFILNKRMCNKFTHRLLFTNKDIQNTSSTYQNIILGKALDDLIFNVTNYDEILNDKIKHQIEINFKDKLKIYNLQNITRDIINIKSGIEIGFGLERVSVVEEKDQLFEIIEDFDISAHAYLIMVIGGINQPINEVGVLANVFETIRSYFNSCNIKDLNININNYKHIIESIGKSSTLIEKYNNSQTRSLLILTITEVLFMAMEVFELSKTNGLGERIAIDGSYKNTQVEILKDLIDTDVLKVFKIIIQQYDNLFLVNQALRTIESKE